MAGGLLAAVLYTLYSILYTKYVCHIPRCTKTHVFMVLPQKHMGRIVGNLYLEKNYLSGRYEDIEKNTLQRIL